MNNQDPNWIAPGTPVYYRKSVQRKAQTHDRWVSRVYWQEVAEAEAFGKTMGLLYQAPPIRKHPMNEQECHPKQPQPMFDGFKLRSAYENWKQNDPRAGNGIRYLEGARSFLKHLLNLKNN